MSPLILRATGYVGSRFLTSRAPMRIIQGPIESGKTWLCAGALYEHMVTFPAWDNGVRRTRYLISRSTYPELLQSTIRTVLTMFDERLYGEFIWTNPPTYKFRFMDVESDWVFMSLADDTQDTLKQLRSTEFTGAWYNEMQFAPRRLVMEMTDRTGRGANHGLRRLGLSQGKFFVGDMNAPEDPDHWVLRMRGDVDLPDSMPEGERLAYVKPKGLQFFVQPPALIEVKDRLGKHEGWRVNPRAENLKYMSSDRYLTLSEGKTRDEILRDLCNEVVVSRQGEPVVPMFVRDQHVFGDEFEPNPNHALLLGNDHGLTPATVVGQQINGVWYIWGELTGVNQGASEFSPRVREWLGGRFPFVFADGGEMLIWGDPDGDWGNSAGKVTAFDIWQKELGVRPRTPTLKDNPKGRIEMIRKVFTDFPGGVPRIMVHKSCRQLIRGLDGGAVVRVTPASVGREPIQKVLKNKYSHAVEALMYLLWGGGEMQVVRGRERHESSHVNMRTGRVTNRRIGMGSGVGVGRRNLYRVTGGR